MNQNEPTSADGVEGCLIYCHVTNQHLFRVYDKDHNFIDYEIHHSDLWVTIKDKDAFFYRNADVIDHSPETLGLK